MPDAAYAKMDRGIPGGGLAVGWSYSSDLVSESNTPANYALVSLSQFAELLLPGSVSMKFVDKRIPSENKQNTQCI